MLGLTKSLPTINKQLSLSPFFLNSLPMEPLTVLTREGLSRSRISMARLIEIRLRLQGDDLFLKLLPNARQFQNGLHGSSSSK